MNINEIAMRKVKAKLSAPGINGDREQDDFRFQFQL